MVGGGAYVEVPRGNGKALATDTLVPTPNRVADCNGDIGTIARIETVEDGEAVTVAWDDRETTLAREDLDGLVLAYAITTHKAQGAEYPVVIAPVTTGHYPLLSAPVLYTAITRARERVVLVRALAEDRREFF